MQWLLQLCVGLEAGETTRGRKEPAVSHLFADNSHLWRQLLRRGGGVGGVRDQRWADSPQLLPYFLSDFKDRGWQCPHILVKPQLPSPLTCAQRLRCARHTMIPWKILDGSRVPAQSPGPHIFEATELPTLGPLSSLPLLPASLSSLSFSFFLF